MNGNLSVPSPSQLLETVFKKWHEEAVHTRESYSKTSGVADKKSLKWYSERIQQYEALCEGLREIKIKVRYLDFVGAGMEHGRSIERAGESFFLYIVTQIISQTDSGLFSFHSVLQTHAKLTSKCLTKL